MASFTITVPDAQLPRVRAAMKIVLGTPADPTATEVQAWMRAHLVTTVLDTEQSERNRAALATANAGAQGTF
jgi:hypothetical protein